MKRLGLLLVFILSLSLTGCIQEYKAKKEQTDAVAEYMAGKLLEYDAEYERTLITYEGIVRSDDTDSDNEDQSENNIGENQIKDESDSAGSENSGKSKDHNLSEVIGKKDFNIQYDGYQTSKVYPDEEENPYFSLTARDNYQLLVVSFKVENISDSVKEFNLSKGDILYQLDINLGSIYKPQFTLLENDLKYINLKIKGGEKEFALLVFEIPDKADMSNIKLTVSNDNRSKTIQIK